MTDTTVTLDRFDRSVAGFAGVLAQVQPEQWAGPTPCSEWDVRALANHVCGEQRWMTPLLGGRSMAEVGSSLDGDLLGEDPVAAFDAAAAATRRALHEADLEASVDLSSGATTVRRYCEEVTADTLVHTWDLARAIGAPEQLPEDLVEVATQTVQPWVQPAGVPGLFATPVQVSDDADAQTRLLAMLGRTA